MESTCFFERPMSDPFHIATRALRTGARTCVDCGAKYQPAAGASDEAGCCETCHARRLQLVEQLADRFHLVPKEAVAIAEPAGVGPRPCSDCGKEFHPTTKGLNLSSCCEECHARRVDLVAHLADKSFGGGRPRWRRKKQAWYRSKRLWIPVLVVALLSGAVWFGLKPAQAVYHGWRERKHFERASAYFEKGDFKRAIIDARNALVFNGENREAMRIVAKALEAARSPAALEWRATLGRLAPEDVENSFGWASGALQSGDYPTAD